MDRTRWQLPLAFAAVYLAWGSTYLAIRVAVETIPPLLMAGVRHLVAGALLYAWARSRGAAAPTRIHWRSALVIGALLLFVANGGVSWAEQTVPSGLTALLVSTVPLWMVLLHGVTAGRAAWDWRAPIGVVLGLAGVALLVDPRSADAAPALGAAVLLVASVVWAAGSLYARRAPLPAVPLLGTGMELLAGGALLVVVGLGIGEGARLDPAAVSPESFFALGYLIVVGSLVGFSAYIYLLNHASPAQASTYAYVNPVVAVALGWGFAGEPFTARTALAGAIILAAVILLSLPKKSARLAGASRPAGVPAK